MICCTMIIIIIIIISPKKGSEQGYLNKDTDKGPGQMKDIVWKAMDVDMASSAGTWQKTKWNATGEMGMTCWIQLLANIGIEARIKREKLKFTCKNKLSNIPCHLFNSIFNDYFSHRLGGYR